MEQQLIQAMKLSYDPYNRKFWTWDSIKDEMSWHDKIAGTITVYITETFDTYCLDLAEALGLGRPNNLDVAAIKSAFRTVEF